MYNTHTHTRVCIYISIYINKFWVDYRIFPICACAKYHFLTQLPNALAQCYLQRASAMLLTMYSALARCQFALAQWYLQRASAMLPTMYNALARCH